MESDITVEHYTAERIPNPNPEGELPWQVYHTARNAILRCCRDFGRAGPMDECPITQDEEIPSKLWHVVKDYKPLDFFVVDDQYNDERYVYVEVCRPEAFTGPWLKALTGVLKGFDGWGVGINFAPDAYILAFADKLMVTGSVLERCKDFTSVVNASQAQFERYYNSNPKT